MTALWILFSSFCSACILASIQCLRETLAFIDVAFVQFLFVLAVTVVVMLVRQVPFSTHVWHLHLLRSIIGVGVVITQIITAMNMPVAAAQTLQYTSPLFVAGFSAIASFRNGEHIDWRILASITAAFIGILVMFHPSERSFPAVYVPIGLLCGLFTAAAILILKKLGSVNEPVPRTVFYFHLHGAVVLGVLELFCGQLTVSQLQQTPLALMLIFLTCAQFARALGWGKGNTFLGAVFTFSGVVFAAFIDSAFFGVTPSLRSLFGMLIIVAAAAACLGLIAKAEKTVSSSLHFDHSLRIEVKFLSGANGAKLIGHNACSTVLNISRNMRVSVNPKCRLIRVNQITAIGDESLPNGRIDVALGRSLRHRDIVRDHHRFVRIAHLKRPIQKRSAF